MSNRKRRHSRASHNKKFPITNRDNFSNSFVDLFVTKLSQEPDKPNAVYNRLLLDIAKALKTSNTKVHLEPKLKGEGKAEALGYGGGVGGEVSAGHLQMENDENRKSAVQIAETNASNYKRDNGARRTNVRSYFFNPPRYDMVAPVVKPLANELAIACREEIGRMDEEDKVTFSKSILKIIFNRLGKSDASTMLGNNNPLTEALRKSIISGFEKPLTQRQIEPRKVKLPSLGSLPSDTVGDILSKLGLHNGQIVRKTDMNNNIQTQPTISVAPRLNN